MSSHLKAASQLVIPTIALIGCLSTASLADTPTPKPTVTFDHLTCEYLDNPQGIDTAVPRLSWREASPKSYTQTSYRIIVASSPALLGAGKGDLWDSGKVNSPRTTLISYGGVPLKSRRQCWWSVQTWDTRGHLSDWSRPATFSMGLLSPQDWKGVWIGKSAQAPKTDFAALSGARWIWFPEAGQPNASAPLGTRYFRLAVDLLGDRPIKRASFIGTADNEFTLFVNGKQAGEGTDWYQVQTLDVTKLVHSGPNLLAVQARNVGDNGPNPAGLIGALKVEYLDGSVSLVQTDTAWKSSQTANSGWTTQWYEDSDWQPAMDLGAAGMQPWGDLAQAASGFHSPLAARYLRREFTTRQKVVRATAYVCGLGFFQLYVNGKPATNHIMDPALSDYRKADYYVTTDVTRLLQTGRNSVGVVLGNGRFYAPRPNAVNFGVPRLLMQIEITYADGSKQTVVSDGSWKVTDQGPIRANNEYDGESYDARMAMAGWMLPGFAGSPKQWSAADVLPAPGGTLQSQMLEPMRVTGVVQPIKVSSPQPGKYIVDMGRTFYGTVRLKAQGKRGTTVHMTSAYALLPDGTLKTADNRSALTTDSYTFAGGGQETWNPIFKGQGFRRVQVTGFPGKPTVANFDGMIEHTDALPVGSFSCSSTLVNKIHKSMQTGMIMFLRSAPLDPDRDERQAWMGDPAKDSESEAYNFDVAAFYTKWMDDVRHSQRADGTIPDVAMYWEMGAGVEWPSVFTIIPDWFTGFYADTGLEQKNYDAMKHWVIAMQHLHSRPDGTLEGVGYGDWCDTYTIGGKVGDNGQTPLDLVATSYQYNNERIMQHAAERLGKADDVVLWKNMADALSAAFLHKFFDPATCTYTSGTQCSYVLPLAFGLVPPDPTQRQAIIDNLVHDIMVTHDKHLTVGLIGNQWLLQVLTNCGRADVAWSLVTQTTRPSWGYMVSRGSDAIWERWDYDTRDPGMNSESLLIQAGNVDAWFYQTLGGINYDPKKPGFSHIVIHPQMLGDLKWVKCHFDSPHGRIVSDWTRTGQNVTMNVTIPANTTATVITPDGVAHEMLPGSWKLSSQLKPQESDAVKSKRKIT